MRPSLLVDTEAVETLGAVVETWAASAAAVAELQEVGEVEWMGVAATGAAVDSVVRAAEVAEVDPVTCFEVSSQWAEEPLVAEPLVAEVEALGAEMSSSP